MVLLKHKVKIEGNYWYLIVENNEVRVENAVRKVLKISALNKDLVRVSYLLKKKSKMNLK